MTDRADSWLTALGRAWIRLPAPMEHLAVLAVTGLLDRGIRLPRRSRHAGLVITAAGAGLTSAAVHARGPGNVDRPVSLVTHGPHRLVRNPMYVGWSLIHVGLALTLRSPLMLAGWPVSAALIHRVVLQEERTLEAAFGADYVVYRAATGRYFPRMPYAPEPTSSNSGLTPALNLRAGS